MRLNLFVSTLVSVLYVAALPSKLTGRGDAAALLQKCITKGDGILQKIQSATTDTAGLTDKYDNIYKTLATDAELSTDSGTGEEISDLFGGAVSDEIIKFTVARADQETAYTNYFDTAKGIIVGADNYNEKFFYIPENRLSNKNNPQRTADNSLNWNTLVGEQYKILGGELSELQHILRFEIENTDTKAIITQVLGASIPYPVDNGWTVLKPNGATENMFKALLGTDNGQGAGFMLKDYRASMNGKSIQAIRVKEEDDEFYMIVDF
ncbi:hypothetical protein C8R43DRAFT_1044429 [Mycena crocata]|nr:hypothetical protein C8R43DRAFT_1044429 [Mycena crocata]